MRFFLHASYFPPRFEEKLLDCLIKPHFGKQTFMSTVVIIAHTLCTIDTDIKKHYLTECLRFYLKVCANN